MLCPTVAETDVGLSDSAVFVDSDDEGIAHLEGGREEQEVFMFGRLAKCVAMWRHIGCSAVVLSWVLYGFRWEWRDGPPPPSVQVNSPGAFEFFAETTLMVDRLVRVGCAMEVEHRPHICAPLKTIRKAAPGKFRLCHNLRVLSPYLLVRRFKYESLFMVESVFRPGDWMWSIDLKGGYEHLGINSSLWQFLGFSWAGRFYVMKVLPFGLAVAPYAFTVLMRQVVRDWRSKGFRLLQYLDDFGGR